MPTRPMTAATFALPSTHTSTRRRQAAHARTQVSSPRHECSRRAPW
jgi:hypothetical protein